MAYENLSINERVQRFLVNLLRYAFTSNPDFTYSSSLDDTMVAIYSAFPKMMPGYPIVLVQYPTLDFLPRTFGDDQLLEVHDTLFNIDGATVLNGLCYQVYGGGANLNFTISIFGRTNAERNIIADWVISYLRHLYRFYLEDNAVDVISLDKVGDVVEPFGADLIYGVAINIQIFTEWERVIYNDGILVEQIIPSFNTILPDGTTTEGV